MWIKAAASGGLSQTHSIQCDQDEERSYTFLANSWLPAQEAGGSGLGDTVVSLWNTYSSRWFSGLLEIG
ncbi:MAG: hypothetical protein KDK48_06620, partial [Chlamydiia bacterium]|nr:hypothetical protein [Chlamydiia bacterium]